MWIIRLILVDFFSGAGAAALQNKTMRIAIRWNIMVFRRGSYCCCCCCF